MATKRFSNIPNDTRVIHGFNIDSVTTAPLQLTQYAYLEASNVDVFEVVSDHASLHKFTKTIKHIDIDNAQSKSQNCVDVGTLRFCRTPAMLTIQESIACWQPPLMYGYMIRNFQTILPNHLGMVLTEPIANGHTLLTWRTYFNGKLIGGRFATLSLGIILPDLVGNIAKHFNGRSLTAAEAQEYL